MDGVILVIVFLEFLALGFAADWHGQLRTKETGALSRRTIGLQRWRRFSWVEDALEVQPAPWGVTLAGSGAWLVVGGQGRDQA